jgi:hypothetical protein
MSEKKEYITRAEALLALDSAITAQDVFDSISEIPAADVEPVVRGEWFLLDDCANAGVYCSVCTKSVFKESAWYKNVHLKSKRCPNCGAHMMERSGSGE